MVLDRAADGGVTFIDSFDVYPFGGGLATVGRTEEILGRLQSSALGAWVRTGKRPGFEAR